MRYKIFPQNTTRKGRYMALDLQTDVGTNSHADGNGKGESADTFRDFGCGQHIAGQCHGGGTAYGIDGTHIQTNHNQCCEKREGDEGRKGQAEQSKEQQIYTVPVKIIQQISGKRTEENGGNRHGSQNDTNTGTGDSYLLAVDRNDGNGGVERYQHQKVGDEEKNESSVPNFFGFSHKKQTPFLCKI